MKIIDTETAIIGGGASGLPPPSPLLVTDAAM